MKKNINLAIHLSEDNMPEQIICSGDDIQEDVDSKAMMLALFDGEKLDTVKIDLWTSDLQINEMDRFVFQTLRSIADTYYKATKNADLANDMQKFIQYFGEKTEILAKE